MSGNGGSDRLCDGDTAGSTEISIKTELDDGEYDTGDLSKPDTVRCDLSLLDTNAMSHQEIMNRMNEELADLIEEDPLLCHLPREMTLEEVKSQITLEYGQAMTVFVRKADGEVLAVVVAQTGTVMDLKHAIQRHVTLKLSREGGPQHISCYLLRSEHLQAKIRTLHKSYPWHITDWFDEPNLILLDSGSFIHAGRYVWKKHWLYYEGQKLTTDHKPLKEYNIRNKDEVSFIKRLQER